MSLVVLGVLVVGAALIIMLYDSDVDEAPVDVDEPEVSGVREVVDTSQDVTEGSEEDPEIEKEEPTMYRTADALGNTMWIEKEFVDIHRPGKGKPVRARKMATATGRRMKEFKSDNLSAAKMMEHPALKKKKGKLEVKEKDGSEGGGEGGDSSGEGEGGKMGKGKGPGG